MILGIDVGNYATKTSNGYIFDSRVSKVGSVLGGDLELIMDGEKDYIGTGSFENEYNKAEKTNFIKLLYSAIITASSDEENQIVVGLPIGQYKEYKGILISRIKENWHKKIVVNGHERVSYITDVEVVPEGALVSDDEFEGIILDPGGRSTDVCLVRIINGKKKITNPISIPQGTLNLFSEVSKQVNSKYGIETKIEDAGYIIRKGLRINGEAKNIEFIVDVFKRYVDSLVNNLKVEYSLSTEDVMVIGGGGALLYKSIKNRIPQATLKNNAIFANAEAYGEVGEQLWQ